MCCVYSHGGQTEIVMINFLGDLRMRCAEFYFDCAQQGVQLCSSLDSDIIAYRACCTESIGVVSNMFCSVWNEFISHARCHVFNCGICLVLDKDITHLTVYPPSIFPGT